MQETQMKGNTAGTIERGWIDLKRLVTFTAGVVNATMESR